MVEEAVSPEQVLERDFSPEQVLEGDIFPEKVLEEAVSPEQVLERDVSSEKVLEEAVFSEKVLEEAVSPEQVLERDVSSEKVLEGDVFLDEISKDSTKEELSEPEGCCRKCRAIFEKRWLINSLSEPDGRSRACHTADCSSKEKIEKLEWGVEDGYLMLLGPSEKREDQRGLSEDASFINLFSESKDQQEGSKIKKEIWRQGIDMLKQYKDVRVEDIVQRSSFSIFNSLTIGDQNSVYEQINTFAEEQKKSFLKSKRSFYVSLKKLKGDSKEFEKHWEKEFFVYFLRHSDILKYKDKVHNVFKSWKINFLEKIDEKIKNKDVLQEDLLIKMLQEAKIIDNNREFLPVAFLLIPDIVALIKEFNSKMGKQASMPFSFYNLLLFGLHNDIEPLQSFPLDVSSFKDSSLKMEKNTILFHPHLIDRLYLLDRDQRKKITKTIYFCFVQNNNQEKYYTRKFENGDFVKNSLLLAISRQNLFSPVLNSFIQDDQGSFISPPVKDILETFPFLYPYLEQDKMYQDFVQALSDEEFVLFLKVNLSLQNAFQTLWEHYENLQKTWNDTMDSF